MTPSRLTLLFSLGAALALVLVGPARADHINGHNHPYCAQGGGNASSGGEGGTIPAGEVAFDDQGGEDLSNTPILIPTHLGERFGLEDPVAERNGDQFIEAFADQIDDAGTGSNGSAFHGGHGGGPGGGQGGSTFLGGGDGGCNPNILEAARRRVPRGGLPVTGSLSDQLALLGGLMLSMGWLMWLVARRQGAELAPAAEAPLPAVTRVTPQRRGYQVVSRLKQQMKGSWAQRGG